MFRLLGFEPKSIPELLNYGFQNVVENPTEIQNYDASNPPAAFKSQIPIDENRLFRFRQKVTNRPKTGGAQIGPKSKNKKPNIIMQYDAKIKISTSIWQIFATILL